MSYLAQAQMTGDDGLIVRIAACAAAQGIKDARTWAAAHIWLLSAQPGWAPAYAAATANDPPVDPAAWVGHAGASPTVITDGMILAGVRQVITDQTPTDPPE